jgi:CheY-like chemotaxis protein
MTTDAIQGHILVVDDYVLNRMQLKRHLEQQGHTVTLAENGRQALEMIERGRFDLVLLDILMPELDGFEVLSQLKADPARRDLPVIVISALDEMDNVIRCIAMGAEDFLPKPFDPLLLKARLGACLEKKRLRDQEIEYLQQVARLTAAAAAVEVGEFSSETLDTVAARPDALGQLGRVFQRMAREVIAREQALRQQVQVLRIEIDEAKKAREVAEITGSDYFRQLKERAQRLRKAECD